MQLRSSVHVENGPIVKIYRKRPFIFCWLFLALCVASTPSDNSRLEDSNSHFQDYGIVYYVDDKNATAMCNQSK